MADEEDEETTEVVVIEKEKEFIGRSWKDIFWMMGAGAMAAIGWKLVDKLWSKGQNSNPPQG